MNIKENNIIKPKKRILTAEGWKRRNIKKQLVKRNFSEPVMLENESKKNLPESPEAKFEY